MNNRFLCLLLMMSLPGMLVAGEFRPYEIKAGVSYYSDEFFVTDGISELGEEKNFEEVYQYYNYYEAIFDGAERIVTFKAYKQGALDFSEIYFYDNAGNPEKKIVVNSDGAETVINFQNESSE